MNLIILVVDMLIDGVCRVYIFCISVTFSHLINILADRTTQNRTLQLVIKGPAQWPHVG